MYLFYFLPALGWGLMPVIASLTKAKPINQLLGTTMMALVCGTLILFFVQPELNRTIVVVTFLSGCLWSIGQYLQFRSFQLMAVSEAMPISNGSQLIGTTLVAVVFFQEWQGVSAFIIGGSGIILILLGIVCTSFNKRQYQQKATGDFKKALFYLLLSSSALVFYVTLPKLFSISGIAVIFPQSIGMFIGSLFFAWIEKEQIDPIDIIKNWPTGIFWSVANISLFLIIPLLGVAKSFTFSQLAVLVSIFGGLYFLKGKKNINELRLIILGSVLITLGILLVGAIK
ncbi:GRP family sugar transporter [Enterococcus termitis]|uniref:Sugar transport protein n=1 Tax=Enterococcus termitis TaxID=332950 RepID=A0A1E5GD90_9ENTE|nr:GRP family sugar transporter [Enterococcus termitis]OEG10683.1 sugar transport protein [Enterococcus termitis]OJG96486.1 hypothetical protein RV18_GL002476 [Enterococcus termitis]